MPHSVANKKGGFSDAEFLSAWRINLDTLPNDKELKISRKVVYRLARIGGEDKKVLSWIRTKSKPIQCLKVSDLRHAVEKATRITSMFNVKDIIRSGAMTAPSKSWPAFDGTELKRHKYVTASEASKCARSLAFQKQQESANVPVENYWDNMSDKEFEDNLRSLGDRPPLGYFARGDTIEDWVVSQLEAMEGDDEHFLFTGENQRSFYTPMRVSGTPDGIYINTTSNELWLLEFKSVAYQVTEPKKEHLTQVQVNMGIITSCMGKWNFSVEWGVDVPPKFAGAKLVYVDSSNWLDINEFSIEFDGGKAYKDAIKKAKKVFKTIHGELRRPEKVEPEGIKVAAIGCHFCEFKQQCTAIERNQGDTLLADLIDENIALGDAPKPPSVEMPKFDFKEKGTVTKVLAQYDRFSADEKKAKQQKDALKGQIVEWLRNEKKTSVAFDDDDKSFKVSLTTTERAGNLDKAKVQEALLKLRMKLSDFCGKSSTSETLRVTVKEVK